VRRRPPRNGREADARREAATIYRQLLPQPILKVSWSVYRAGRPGPTAPEFRRVLERLLARAAVTVLSKTRLFFLLAVRAAGGGRGCARPKSSGKATTTLPMAAARQMLGGKAHLPRHLVRPNPTGAFRGACSGARARAGCCGWPEPSMRCWPLLDRLSIRARSVGTGAKASGSAAYTRPSFSLSISPPGASLWLPISDAGARTLGRPAWSWPGKAATPFSGSGALAGVGISRQPQGLLVAAVCVLWNPAGRAP